MIRLRFSMRERHAQMHCPFHVEGETNQTRGQTQRAYAFGCCATRRGLFPSHPLVRFACCSPLGHPQKACLALQMHWIEGLTLTEDCLYCSRDPRFPKCRHHRQISAVLHQGGAPRSVSQAASPRRHAPDPAHCVSTEQAYHSVRCEQVRNASLAASCVH